METSATFLLRELSTPLKNLVPPERICERLKTKDAQICQLQYGECHCRSVCLTACVDKPIDLDTVDVRWKAFSVVFLSFLPVQQDARQGIEGPAEVSGREVP